MKIAKKIFKFLLLSLLIFLILQIILNWSILKKGFVEGYNASSSEQIK